MRTSSTLRRRATGALAVLALLVSVLVTLGTGADPRPAGATAGPIGLELLGRYASGNPDGGSEITAYDPVTKRMFVTNGVLERVDIVDISDPTAPVLWGSVAVGSPIQSVAVHGNLVAVAAEGVTRQAPGKVVVFDTDGNWLWEATVGALPDMVTFTPDGTKILTANEGEPLHYCRPLIGDETALGVDPEGSISIIDVATQAVSTAGFGAFTDADALRAQGIRIFGPHATVAQDLEPEYITITPDGTTAYVTLQENNALAVVDIATATVTQLIPLGFQQHGTVPIDVSDRDGSTTTNVPAINIATRNANVFGMYMPDTIDSFAVGSASYLVMANEGDGREYPCLLGGTSRTTVQRDDPRASDVGLDTTVFDADERAARGPKSLARLRVSTVFPATKNGSGQLTTAYAFGSRSFTIRNLDGSIVWDSGADIEQRTASLLSARFNGEWSTSTGLWAGFDGRSPNKGPEPEAVAVGEAYGQHLAFVGLERIGGIVVYDVSNPNAPQFVQYVNTSDFTGNYKLGTAGDVSPEGILFVPAADSPTGKPLVIVSYELSGTTAIFQLNGPPTVNAPSDITVAEDAGSVTVDVTLSEDSSETVTVDYELVGDTATAGDDFTSGSGTLTFAPGETTKPVTITVTDDGDDEPDETLRLVLSNPSKALLGRITTTITITDDDPPEVSIDDVSLAEGDRGLQRMVFTVRLTSPAAMPVELWATPAPITARKWTDFLAVPSKVRFAPGQTEQTHTVYILGDRKPEPDETFSVTLTLRKGTVEIVKGTGIGTILNDD